MKPLSLFLALLLNGLQLSAQITPPTQTVKGIIIDKDSRQPLLGATIALSDQNNTYGSTSDIDGKFQINDVPVGRKKILCSYLGYESYKSSNLIVTSAKVVELSIELTESGITTDEVLVTAFQHSNAPLNELSIVSTRSFSVEETQRYAASANDPSRMAMGFPGVQPSRDSRSDIVIRGNSGIGLLWRLEGIDIPNPNHFARRGSSGGGITVFSVSMLSNSDFSTGAFPAEYGNAFSGVFDIKLRKGNREKQEYSFRAGMLGLDFSTEGPIKKGRSSYLLNYRYSTLGLLNQMGIYLVNPRTDNIFQDLSFNLYFPSVNGKSTLSVWGISGLSDEFSRAIDDLNDNSTFSERLTRDFQTNMGAVGINHTYLIDDRSYIKTSLALTGQKIIFRNDTLSNERNAITINDESYTDARYVLGSFYNRKLSTRVALKTGFFLKQINYNFFHKDQLNTNESITWINAEGSTQLIQPYIQFRYRANEKLTLNAGAHAMFLTLNNTNSIEPRIGVQYQASSKTVLSFAYGLHSRILPLGTYFTQINGGLPNKDLDLIKSHHLVAAYEQALSKLSNFRVELYYQRLYDIPASPDPGNNYSIINDVDGFATEALESVGSANNIGIDLSFEQAFRDGFFMLLSGSIFDSKFSTDGDNYFNTRYNSNYSATFMSGKEFSLRGNATLQTGLKLLFNGGARTTPLLPGQNSDGQNPPWDWDTPFTLRVAPYFRPDIRIAYRKDNTKNSWLLSLDVQNLINRRNEDALDRTYDPDTNSWTSRNQSGLTPLLSFQIDF